MKNFPINVGGKQYWISRSVAVVINVYMYINGKLCVLANKRGPGLPNKVGLWNCPSGYLDYGEDLMMAARRELWEETGVKLGLVLLRMREIDSDPDRENQTVLVRYSTLINPPHDIESPVNENNMPVLTSEHSEPDEVEEIKFIPVDEVDNYEWTSERHKELIKKYAQIEANESK